MTCCITSTLSHLVYHLAAVPWLFEQGTGSHKWIRLTGARTCRVKSWPKKNTDLLLRQWYKMGVSAQLIENYLQESMLGLGTRIWRSLPGTAWTRHEQVHSTLWRYGIMRPRISMVQVPNSAFCLQNLSETSLCPMHSHTRVRPCSPKSTRCGVGGLRTFHENCCCVRIGSNTSASPCSIDIDLSSNPLNCEIKTKKKMKKAPQS